MEDNRIEQTTETLPTRPKRVLVVGAGGFAGGFIVEEALRRGYETWAGIRESTSRQYLGDERIKFLTLDFDTPESLGPTMRAALPEGEKWDYVVYNLGATKCVRFSDFSRINYEYLRHFTEALTREGLLGEKLLYISSLSAMGPGDEKSGAPFTERMLPGPNTRYGASKLKAEMWLAMSGMPHIILRPTGLYGPRDKDYFLMFESIAKGWDFSVGFRKQNLTFLYITDLATAIFDALEKAPAGETYNIGHPAVWSQAQFRRLAQKELGKKFVIPMRMPLFAVKGACAIAEQIGAATGKPSTLNSDKYNILRQRNWTLDVSKARRDFGFAPKTDLPEGVALAVKWYKDNNWL